MCHVCAIARVYCHHVFSLLDTQVLISRQCRKKSATCLMDEFSLAMPCITILRLGIHARFALSTSHLYTELYYQLNS